MLIDEMKQAKAANDWGRFSGSSAPPINRQPPAAVMPEIAFVTDISGECSAGLTPQTVW